MSTDTPNIITKPTAEAPSLRTSGQEAQGFVGQGAGAVEVIPQLRLEAEEAKLQEERKNVSAAIRQNGTHAMLTDILDELDEKSRTLSLRRDELERRSRQLPALPSNSAELKSMFEGVSKDLATESLESGDLLRLLVPEFHGGAD